MSEGSLLLQIVIIIILTGINAFFSSAEMAIVSLNKNKLKLSFSFIPNISPYLFALITLSFSNFSI